MDKIDKIFKNNIMVSVIIVLILIGFYLFFREDSLEHLSTGSNAVLSNEAVQNMASVLNSGTGIINNLKIKNSLQIGDLTIDNTGKIIFPGGKWTLGLEDPNIVLRYTGTQGSDIKYAFKPDGNVTLGATSSIGGTLNVSNDVNISNNLVVTKNITNTGNCNFGDPTSEGGGVVNINGHGLILGNASDPNRCWMYQNVGDGYFHISPLNGDKLSWDYNQGIKFPIPKKTGMTTTIGDKVYDLGTAITPLRASANNDCSNPGGNGVYQPSNNQCVAYCDGVPDAFKALYDSTSRTCFCKTSFSTTYDPSNVGWFTTKIK